MTIEIDDSGTGDLIGSAFILFWRRETNTLITREVPLELYQDSNFNSLTKEHIKSQFIEVIAEMDIPKTEEIYLCTGNCFDAARAYLRQEGYNVIDAKIEGYMQDLVEQTYLNHIIAEYGVPADKVTLESGKERFFALFHWVAKDFPRRHHYVKSGFDKWRTRWIHEAEKEWMHQMVDVPTEYYPEDLSPASEEERAHSTDSRAVKRPKRTNYRKPTKNTARIPRKVNASADGSRPSKPRRTSGRTPKPNPNRGKDTNKRYSSTDPNPRRKFF